MTDYRTYDPGISEIAGYYIICIVAVMAVGLLFYDSIWAGLLLFCLTPFFEGKYAEFLKHRRLEKIKKSFKDALFILSASMAAGRQLPGAIEDTADALHTFYGPSDIVAYELRSISDAFKNTNADVCVMLGSFAERCGIEDIKLFAKSCEICKKTGGNLEDVCLESAYLLIEKMEFYRERDAILSEKKTDILILVLIPLLVLTFLRTSSLGYIEILYESISGRIIMTLCLALMSISILMSFRIMKSEI